MGALTGTNYRDIASADLNRDGLHDVVIKSEYAVFVFFSNGNGTFGAGIQLASDGAISSGELELQDMTGDGILDIISYGGDFPNLIVNNGNGTFQTARSIGLASGSPELAVGDINGDGVLDFATFDSTDGARDFKSNTNLTTTLRTIDLNTRAGALEAISFLDGALQRVNSEIGKLGSGMSRMERILRTLETTRENYIAAASRITDVDVASESADLTRTQILQNTASALLGQANQAPALALVLLGR